MPIITKTINAENKININLISVNKLRFVSGSTNFLNNFNSKTIIKTKTISKNIHIL